MFKSYKELAAKLGYAVVSQSQYAMLLERLEKIENDVTNEVARRLKDKLDSLQMKLEYTVSTERLKAEISKAKLEERLSFYEKVNRKENVAGQNEPAVGDGKGGRGGNEHIAAGDGNGPGGPENTTAGNE